jgi:uncharacterized membrane protein YfcA
VTATIIAVVAVAMAVAFAQGVAGFGFALLAVPALAVLLPVKEAVVLSTIIGAANSSYQAVLLRTSIDGVRVRRYLWGSLAGSPMGFAVFRLASPDVLRAVVGMAVLGGTVVVARVASGEGHRPVLDRSMAFVSGVLLTSTSTNGPPLVLALRAQGVPTDVFRATLALVFAVTGVAASCAFAIAGSVDVRVAALAAAALPAVAVGARLGFGCRDRVGGAAFSRLVIALLVAGALGSVAPFAASVVG